MAAGSVARGPPSRPASGPPAPRRARPRTASSGCAGSASAWGVAATRRRPRTAGPGSGSAASMSRSSVATVRPWAAAIGAAVSWARSRGEAPTWVMSRSAIEAATISAISQTERGQVEVREPAVEDLVGVVDLAVAHEVDDGDVGGRLAGCSRGVLRTGRCGCSGSSRECVGDPLEGEVVVGGRDEPGLEGAGRQRDSLVEHRVEERAEPIGGLRLRRGVVGDDGCHRGIDEEDAEQVPRLLQDVRPHPPCSGPRTRAVRPRPQRCPGRRRPRRRSAAA